QPVIQLQDASGNAVSESGIAITASVSAGGTLVGIVTVDTDEDGVATFTDLGISGTVGDYTLIFSSTPLMGAISGTVTLGAGDASRLVVTGHPAAGASGDVFTTQPVVEIRDASGNVVTTDNSTGVTVEIAFGDGGALTGTTTLTASSGVVAFTDLAISGKVGTAYVLKFMANPILKATESKVMITGPGAASQLSVTTEPSAAAQNGKAFAQQPKIQLRDASGNAVSESGIVIT